MANSLSNIVDKILAQGLSTLRESAVMARLTHTMTGDEAAQKGTTVDIPTPRAQTVSDVTAAPTHSSAASNTPGLVQVTMSNWKKTNFYLTDKEMVEIDRNRHFMPMQTSEAARALANNLDSAILANYTGIYGFVGTAGTTPFSTVATAPNARKVLNEQLAPLNPRRIVVDPTAEAQALQLAAFADLSQTGDADVKIEGLLGRKVGFDWYMSQNIPTHTAGTATTSVLVASTTAAGSSTLGIKTGSSASAGTLLLGDVFTIAGNSQTYVVTANANVSVAQAAVAIRPALAAAASANSVITVKATHVVNLAFHPMAFVWATRPLDGAVSGEVQSNPSRVLADPLSGVTMRLEVIRQNKQTAWEFDFLHGSKLVRPELAVRIAG